MAAFLKSFLKNAKVFESLINRMAKDKVCDEIELTASKKRDGDPLRRQTKVTYQKLGS